MAEQKRQGEDGEEKSRESDESEQAADVETQDEAQAHETTDPAPESRAEPEAAEPEPAARESVSVRLSGGTKLGVEIGAQVLISRSGQEDRRMACEFAGASTNEFLIIKAPLIPGVKDMFREGDGVTVRYLAKGVLYGFRVHVLNAVFKPAPLIFIEYPYSVEKIELRRDTRVDCMLPCSIELESGDSVSAMIIDLSLSGCRLACILDRSEGCEKLLQAAEGKSVTLSFTPPSGNSPVRIGGRLKSLSSSGNSAYTGIEFYEPDEATRKALTEYINDVELYSGL
jgi:c-di-GMP-binding flagellar brake protein YcgR